MTMTTSRPIHCWTSRREFLGDAYVPPPCPHGGHDEPDWAEYQCLVGADATCLLEAGHPGEHVWTSDALISIVFAPAPEAV